ncbi:MAG: ABC transporter ATP-binding protein [Spirochaetales bacterium]|nr:ABC transporter ATP-binding protein [Spirochaetales bacterium]
MIEMNNLTKSFGSTVAVNNISLTIPAGSLFGLLGPNGAGKTTLINLITGLVSPDSGTVRFPGLNGKKATREVKSKLGLVPQDQAFYLNYSAGENITFFAGLYGLKGKVLKEAVERALEFTGLTDTGKKRAKDFSGGMKRRLNIACGIVHNPDIIILDEPTVGIDPQSRNHILRSVEKLQKEGRTIIYTTHYMEEAEALCSDIAILDKGKIIARGTQEELKLMIQDHYRVIFTLKRPEKVDLQAFKKIPGVRHVELEDLFLKVTSEVGIGNLNQLTEEVNRQQILVTDIKSDSPSLETVFLNLTGRSLRD